MLIPYTDLDEQRTASPRSHPGVAASPSQVVVSPVAAAVYSSHLTRKLPRCARQLVHISAHHTTGYAYPAPLNSHLKHVTPHHVSPPSPNQETPKKLPTTKAASRPTTKGSPLHRQVFHAYFFDRDRASSSGFPNQAAILNRWKHTPNNTSTANAAPPSPASILAVLITKHGQANHGNKGLVVLMRSSWRRAGNLPPNRRRAGHGMARARARVRADVPRTLVS